ncbi:uncharacterized protein LOC132637444 [Lycium barbarum]|uniref:uncharacterized protein LOC132637444 n=1 Tax=Lycium barbarum TaxID=112863 RepID=UPI00293E78F5|nr:uncharacterized protein LOC132637444 [Lycium barbarum]
MRSRYGLHIGYHKAWRSLQHTYNVIKGSPENNYTLLPQYLHMMKLRNPGTVANIKWTADNKFKYTFFAYGASIEGWKHCRPVMMVDATFLKSKYRGVLMIAVAKDGNNSIFPLAFGIADSENNESYRWFFRHVKKVFGTRKDLSILSDRHSSIATAIKELYPDTQHGICIYHMEKNLQKYFPSEAILSLFYNAATTYKQAEFRTYMSQIQQIDPKAAEYIEEEPPERWARSFHTNRRYNMVTTNNVKTMNFVLRKARELPIMACIYYIQNKLQNWFYQRKLDATGPSHDLTCWAEKILLEKISRGFTMKVENKTPVKFVVKDEGYQYNVDLKNMTCECLEFQTDELPCTHVMAVIDKRSLPKCTYCADWFKKQACQETYKDITVFAGKTKLVSQRLHPSFVSVAGCGKFSELNFCRKGWNFCS